MLTSPPSSTTTLLAERLGPKTIAEVVGQNHLLSKAKLHASAIVINVPLHHDFLEPTECRQNGSGGLLANAFGAEMITLTAIIASVTDIREIIECAQLVWDTFADELHWFNKVLKSHINQYIVTFIVRISRLPYYSVEAKHA